MKTVLLFLLAQVPAQDLPPPLPRVVIIQGHIGTVTLDASACARPLVALGKKWHCQSDNTLVLSVPVDYPFGPWGVMDGDGQPVAIVDVGMTAPPPQEEIMGNVRDKKIGNVIRRQRVVTEFICTVCHTKYHTLGLAQECAAMPVELRQFPIGARVTWCERASCEKGNKQFTIIATVLRVTRPEPPDEEYTNKWLHGKVAEIHVRQYEVAFECLCGRRRTSLLYAAEMRRI